MCVMDMYVREWCVCVRKVCVREGGKRVCEGGVRA